MSSTRTYCVTPKAVEGQTTGPARLVEASNQAQALRHVAQDTLEVEVANGLQVARLMETGTKLEVAGE